MSENEAGTKSDADPSAKPPLDNEVKDHFEGLKIDPTSEDEVDKKLAAIEMAGEEASIGFKPAPHDPLSPEVRYLHCSRTIHELISDRNRSVGIFLLVASVLINASSGLLQTTSTGNSIVPMESVRYWCLPATFGTLAVLGLFTSLLLIRTRIGLIYEVTKMNVLLGLPSKRVERVNPLSVFYLMHILIAVLGGASAGFTLGAVLLPIVDAPTSVAAGFSAGLLYVAFFQIIYYRMVLRATTETKLAQVKN